MRITSLLFTAIWTPTIVLAQKIVLPLDSRHTVWQVAPQADMPHSEGDRVSTTGFKLKNAIEGVVPGTVFTAYVNAGKEKDPNYGTNILESDEAFTTILSGTGLTSNYRIARLVNGCGCVLTTPTVTLTYGSTDIRCRERRIRSVTSAVTCFVLVSTSLTLWQRRAGIL